MSPVASFHLVTERAGRQPLVLARLGLDRRRLRIVDGLVFARTLGTGRGSSTGASIDARRSALFAVWANEGALDAFVTSHPIARRWSDADEAWHVRLRLLEGHGCWAGLGIDDLGPAESPRAEGPVAVLTRATIRPGATISFIRASKGFGDAAGEDPGNLAVVGIGERPIGRLGTFSVWQSHDAARRFATGRHEHRVAMRRARSERWFTDELFATFRPFDSSGTWAGVDPLGDQSV